MSKYFTSVYKNYLNKIESDKTLEINYNALKDKLTLLNSSFNSYVGLIDNSSWEEDGKQQIINTLIPKIKNSNNKLINGTLNNMDKVISLIKNDLYKSLVELKEKDDEYCMVQERIKTNEKLSSDMNYNNAKLRAMDLLLVNLTKKIDNIIIEIKSYNDLDDAVSSSTSLLEPINMDKAKDELMNLYKKVHKNDDSFIGELKYKIEENRLNKLFSGSLSSNITYVDDIEETKEEKNDNCVSLSLLNENWDVVNTAIPVSEYASVAYNKGIRQDSNPKKYSDYCLAFSYVHASNLYNGQVDDSAESAYKWNHATEFYDYFNDDKQETLRMVYSQVKEGKPVVMQVNGNSSGTHRHFVTVVGVKSSVNNINDVSESDLLILDSWDGKLERMDREGSRFMTTGKQSNKNYTGYYLRVLK